MKIVVVMGPTASGKSAMALELAQKRNGEIISADSMQLYRGLEIGTAQPSKAEQLKVCHHLVGCFPFTEKIDVYRYCELADEKIAEVAGRGHLPIICGGTGFYLKALLYGLDDLPGDAALRQELDAKYDSDAGYPALVAEMKKLDPQGLAKWSKCRRKLIRALEVRLLAGKSILELQKGQGALRYEVEAYRIEMAPEKLRDRILARAEKMLDSGWMEEAHQALAQGLLVSPTAHQAIGYRDIGEYLAGKIDRQKLLERIVTATCQYARRQRTWFRHQHPEAEIIAL